MTTIFGSGGDSRVTNDVAAPAHGRIGRALSLSLGSHVVAAAMLVLLATGRSSPPTDLQPPISRTPLAFVPARTGIDDGGIGERSGNHATSPARGLERQGPDRVTIAWSTPPAVEASDHLNPSDAPQTAIVPVQPFASGLLNLDGLPRPQPLGDPASLGPGGGIGTGEGPAGPGGNGRSAGPGTGDGPAGRGRVSSPQLVRKVDPEYTSAAMHAKLQGTVVLEAVVLADGSVGDVRIVRSLDSTFGLDLNAIRAVRQWRFAPGSQYGKPVAVVVTVELTYTLR
jgi:protein TonB